MKPWEMTRDEYVKVDLANKRKRGVVGSGRFGGAKRLRSESEIWHKRFVKDAIEKGKPVPPEVLKDYPELTQKRENIMNRSQKLIKLFEGFSSDVDAWFDELADLASSEGVPQELISWANERHGSSEAEYEEFKRMLQEFDDTPAISKVLDFTGDIDRGKYKGEFANKFGGQVSQVSELFSMFRQAVLYHE